MRESVRVGAEVFHALKSVLKSEGLSTTVGDEGGFAPNIATAHDALEAIVLSIRKAGYQPGKGQIDKAGKPYMFHPINVALGVRGVRAKTVALLHDILEDSNLYSFDDFDFLDNEQREAILLLTHSVDRKSVV